MSIDVFLDLSWDLVLVFGPITGLVDVVFAVFGRHDRVSSHTAAGRNRIHLWCYRADSGDIRPFFKFLDAGLELSQVHDRSFQDFELELFLAARGLLLNRDGLIDGDEVLEGLEGVVDLLATEFFDPRMIGLAGGLTCGARDGLAGRGGFAAATWRCWRRWR